MENSFLGMKVIFAEEFLRICEAFGEDYNEIREAWLLDPRINPSHTFAGKEGQPGFGGKCLPKDISAIIHASKNAGHNPEFLDVEIKSSLPSAVKTPRRQTVISIEDQWRIDDEWWRGEPVSRHYYALILSSGQRLTLYHDLIQDLWYKQKY